MEQKPIVFLARTMTREERAARAEREGAELIRARRAEWDRIVDAAHKDIRALQARGSKSKVAVVARFKQAASALSDDWAPLASCSKGCVRCCTGFIGLEESDARHVAEATGARIAKPKGQAIPVASAAALGPCPFLKDQACSIYPHRPLACRTTIGLDAVPEEDCGPGATGLAMGNRNGALFREAAAHYTGDRGQRDIREWFPTGLKR